MMISICFFNDTATTEIYTYLHTLSLHDALPIYIRNALIQNFTENRGKLFQAKGDVDYDLDGFLSNIAAGVRYAHRSAEEQAVNLNKATPGGNIGTGSEATAVLVSDTGLPDDFLVLGSRAPDRSEEHTSELQSLMRTSYAVFCLIKKKMTTHSILYT